MVRELVKSGRHAQHEFLSTFISFLNSSRLCTQQGGRVSSEEGQEDQAAEKWHNGDTAVDHLLGVIHWFYDTVPVI